MNFLFPAMLAGLVGLAVPTAIHLIARHRFPVRDFPTIRLMRFERRDNVFAARLVDPLQLLLRLLLLALFVLAMSRLFSPASEEPAPRNLIVLIDTSASMRVASSPDEESGGPGPRADGATPLAAAKDIARTLLRDVGLPSRCALVTAGDDIQVVSPMGGDPQAAAAATAEIQASDGTGPGLVRAVAHCAEMVRGRRETKSQIVVLTDLRASAFETRNEQDLDQILAASKSLGEQLEILVVDVGTPAADNLAIASAILRGGQARTGDNAHVITTVKNLGPEERTVKLALTVAGAQEPAFRPLKLASKEKVVVDLTSKRIERPLTSFATVMLQGKDAMMHDNVFSLPFVVRKPTHLLIVNGAAEVLGGSAVARGQLEGLGADEAAAAGPEEDKEEVIDGAKILRYVLNPGKEMHLEYGTGILTEVVTPEAMAATYLSKYDLIVLYDVSKVSDKLREDLDDFVRQGRSLVIVCSAGRAVNPVDFQATLFQPFMDRKGVQRPRLSPGRIGTVKKFDPATIIQPSDPRSADAGDKVTYDPGPWLGPFRDRRQGSLSVVRVTHARSVVELADGANVLLQDGDKEPLAVEIARGNGRVLLLSFGVELSHSNIALSQVFPELMWRMVHYLTGKLRVKPLDSLVAAEAAVLDASDFSQVETLELSPAVSDRRPDPLRWTTGAPEPADADTAEGSAPKPAEDQARTLAISPQENVMVGGLPVGHYWLRRQRTGAAVSSYARPVTVNPDPRESRVTRVPESDIVSLFTDRARLLAPEKATRIAPSGAEYLPWVIAALMAMFVLEAISTHLIGVRRAKKLEAEEAVS